MSNLSAEVRYNFADFTESAYEELLGLALRNWRMIGFSQHRQPGRVCLWRHDIDFSVHRAYRLAELESRHAVTATYFVHLHSKFYNCFEAEVVNLIKRILRMGHLLGLHFDPHFFGWPDAESVDTRRLEVGIRREKAILARLFETSIEAMSIHNPGSELPPLLRRDEVLGMVNAYGTNLRRDFSYVSDSNGYWHFRRLRDVLEENRDDRLHVLTHPEWWTPAPMSPRERVSRCIDGRARRQHQDYDLLLTAAGRKNICRSGADEAEG